MVKREESMKRLWILWSFLLIVLGAIGTFYFLLPWLSTQPLRRFETKTTVTAPEGESIKRSLFFCLEDKLAVEERDLPIPLKEDFIAQLRDVIRELIKGPVSDLRLTPVLPEETKIRGIFIDSNGICYLDFGKEVQERFPGGAWTELLSLYSIVNTLTTNFPEIKGVKILVEGYEVETLAGHIDTRYPLQRRDDLIGQ
jgi:hypothetical protein